ncbi:MAG: leucine-rich repeat protein, partial [Clostridia bacterium]|nr:leucine-rich repeat protein [Clostridia bacterium]
GCGNLTLADGGNETYIVVENVIYLAESIKAIKVTESTLSNTTFSITDNKPYHFFFEDNSVAVAGNSNELDYFSATPHGYFEEDDNRDKRNTGWVKYSYSKDGAEDVVLGSYNAPVVIDPNTGKTIQDDRLVEEDGSSRQKRYDSSYYQGEVVTNHFSFSGETGRAVSWNASGKSFFSDSAKGRGAGHYVITIAFDYCRKDEYKDGIWTKTKTFNTYYYYTFEFDVNLIESVWYYNLEPDPDGADLTETANGIYQAAQGGTMPSDAVVLGTKSTDNKYFAAEGADALFTFDENQGDVTIRIKECAEFKELEGYLFVCFKVSNGSSSIVTARKYTLSDVAKNSYTQYSEIHTVLASKDGDLEIDCDDSISVVIEKEEYCVLGNKMEVGEDNANMNAYVNAYVVITSGTNELFKGLYGGENGAYDLGLVEIRDPEEGMFRIGYNLEAIKALPNAGASATILFCTDISSAENIASSTIDSAAGPYNIARPSANPASSYMRVTATYHGAKIYGTKEGRNTYVFKNNSLAEDISGMETDTIMSIRKVSEFALEGCSSLDSLSIGKAVDTIGAGALINTQGIKEIGVDEENTYFVLYKINPNDPQYAYSGGGLYRNLGEKKVELIAFLGSNTVTEFTLPDNCISIGDYAFSHNTTLERVYLNNVVKIGKKAFYGCTSLKYIEIPAGWTPTGYVYGDSIFEGAGLESVYFTGEFRGIGQLGAAIFGENYDVTVYAEYDDGVIAEYCDAYPGHSLRLTKMTPLKDFVYQKVNGNEIEIMKYRGSSANVIVPDKIENMKVTVIGDAAFEGTSVVTVSLPSYISLIGDYAFSGCESLKELYVNSDPSIKQNLFNGHSSALIVYGITASVLDEYCESIGVAFNLGTTWGCYETDSVDDGIKITGLKNHVCNSSHKHIVIPSEIDGNLVREIAEDAFNSLTKDAKDKAMYEAIESVTIPSSVKRIGAGAFANNSSLKVLRFQNTTIDSIGASYFDATHDVICRTFGDNAALVVYASEYGSTTNVKTFCNGEGIEYHAVLNSDDYELEEINGSYAITDVTSTDASIILPDMINGKKVTEIAKFAFQSANYTAIKLGKYVTKIGEHAFDGCTDLKIVDLPDGLKTSGDLAFNGCNGLTAIFIPASVNTIGDKAFAGCTAIRTLRFLGDVKNVGDNILYGVTMTYESIGTAGSVKSVSFLQVRESATNLYNYFWTKCNVRATKVESLAIERRWEECYEYVVVSDGDDYYIEITGLKDHVCANGGHGDIYIPSMIGGISVKAVRDKAFAGVTSIRSVVFESDNFGDFTMLGKQAFSGCTLLGEVDLGPIKHVGDGAFEGCTLLSKITIPNSNVRSLSETNKAADIAGVFAGCVNLKEIVGLDGTNTLLASNGVIYWGSGDLWDARYVYDLTTEVLNLDRATSVDAKAFDSIDKSAVRIINIPETLS